MPKGDLIELEGVVNDALGGGQYSIRADNGEPLRARLSGKLKKFRIRVMPGDRVRVAVSPYDLTHGMITYRMG